MIIKAYVSGALTGIEHNPGIKKFYEEIAAVCAAEGIEAYVPHLLTDPARNPKLTPQDVYAMDRLQVEQSQIVLAYVGVPSLGVGQELEIAREKNIPIVLLMEKNAVISRMARGNPMVTAEIRFSDFQDALQQLARWLQGWQK